MSLLYYTSYSLNGSGITAISVIAYNYITNCLLMGMIN